MDTTSIVISHPASADGEMEYPGLALAAQAQRRPARPHRQPNPLDSVAQSYQGGAVVTLDFTLEVERPKAAGSTCPTT